MVHTSAPAPPHKKPTVLIVGPVPPPAFGVAKATRLMLDSPVLNESLDLAHLDTSDTLGFAGIGRLNWHNVRLGLNHVWHLAASLGRLRPDVVLLTASQGRLGLARDGLFVLLSRAFKASTLTYLRGSRYDRIRQDHGRVAGALLRSILSHSSSVVVLGETLTPMAREVCPACHIMVIPNGCPPAVSSDQVGVRDESNPMILYVGRLSRDKGLEDLLVSARVTVAQAQQVRFVLCGEWDSPTYERETRPLVAQYGLTDALEFVGPVSTAERAALLARAWALAVPSHSEGQPWVILEAMSAGLPVVATDTGAISETVGDGLGGYVVPVGDSAALAARLTSLIRDARLWGQMAQSAARRYQERFTLEHSHRLLAEELLRIVSERADPTATWFSEHAGRFDRQYSTSSSFADRYRLWTRLILDSCGPGRRVLDAGCGSGVFTAFAAEQGAEVVAVDSSRKMLDLCTDRCGSVDIGSCTFVPKGIEDLDPGELGRFDVLLASSVLEYVRDLPQCLGVLGRLSRTAATLVASFPNPDSFHRRLERVTYRSTRRPRYLSLVTQTPELESLERLLLDAGFSVREVVYYGIPRWLRFLSGRVWVQQHFGTMLAVVATKLPDSTPTPRTESKVTM